MTASPPMMDMDQIIGLARAVGRARIGLRTARDVLTEPDVDSDGNDAVRITHVINPGMARRMTGEDAVKVFMDLFAAASRRKHERPVSARAIRGPGGTGGD